MSEEWLDTGQAAELLGCSTETVSAMARDKVLSAKKERERWYVAATEVEQMRSICRSVSLVEPQTASPLRLRDRESDASMMEVSIALAGVAAAVATFLPSIRGIPGTFKLVVADLSSVVALLSAYGSLWILASYCISRYGIGGDLAHDREDSLMSILGVREVWKLLRNLDVVGPHKCVAGGIVFLMVLSILIGILALWR